MPYDADTTNIQETLTVRLEDTKDLVTSHEADLGDTVRITEGDTDLGGRKTLARKLGDVLDDVLGRGLEPGGGRAAVGESRGRNALAGSVHATHGDSVESTVSTLADGERTSSARTVFKGGGRVLRSCRRRACRWARVCRIV